MIKEAAWRADRQMFVGVGGGMRRQTERMGRWGGVGGGQRVCGGVASELILKTNEAETKLSHEPGGCRLPTRVV